MLQNTIKSIDSPSVYLLCDPSNDLFKIGMTRHMTSQRVKQLQTGNGTELFIVHVYPCQYPNRMESILHKRFMHKKELNEWYRLDNDDVINFIDTCKQIDSIIELMKDNEFFAKNLK